MEKLLFRIPNMQSQHCQMRVTNIINAENQNILNVKDGEITAEIDETLLEVLKTKIAASGYTIDSIEVLS